MLNDFVPNPGQQNVCRCGCGEAIPWKTTMGEPRLYKIGHSAFTPRYTDAGKPPRPPREYSSADIAVLTAETIQKIPDALLYGLIRRGAKQSNTPKEEFLRVVIAEVRRRKMTAAYHWANRLDPPACAVLESGEPCGKPGHYIVGRDTFCRKHALTVGSARLDKYGRTIHSRMAAAWEPVAAHLKGIDSARAHHIANGRKAKHRRS